MEYTMKDLENTLGRTRQHIKNLLKKEEFSGLVNDHIRKDNTTNRVYYDDIILNALLKYYNREPVSEKKDTVEDDVGIGKKESAESENTKTYAPPHDDNTKKIISMLEEQLEEQKRKTEELEKQLQDKEMERLHFISENAKLTNILAAEKKENERLLLLMAPQEKKSFKERIIGFFKKDKD